MSVHTYSSRNFTRNVGAAKRAAARGPVFIIEHGRPAFALLNIEDYYQLAGRENVSLLEIMDAIPGGSDIAFNPPRLQVEFPATKFG